MLTDELTKSIIQFKRVKNPQNNPYLRTFINILSNEREIKTHKIIKVVK